MYNVVVVSMVMWIEVSGIQLEVATCVITPLSQRYSQ